ncbi:MAG: ribosome small subunit-dependent GTPase A [Acidobacteriota bacterium]
MTQDPPRQEEEEDDASSASSPEEDAPSESAQELAQRWDLERWEDLQEDDEGSFEKTSWTRSRGRTRKRSGQAQQHRQRKEQEHRQQLPEGRVISVGARRARVLLGDRELSCRLPAEMAKEQQRLLAVNDRVLVEEEDGTHWVRQVLERSSSLSRPDPRDSRRERVIAANVDRVVVVAGLRQPGLRSGLIDRYLVAVERGGAQAVLAANKLDQVPLPREQDPELALLEPYRQIGLPVVACSTVTGEGLDELRAALAGATCVFVGHSGVGKSSLLNAFVPELQLATQPVQRDGTGRHTTTQSRLYELADGTRIIDTPGIREFGLWDLSPQEVRDYFQEFRQRAPSCHFSDCTHTHEPRCAVQEAVEEGEIAPQRYEAYLRILNSLESDL